MAIENKGKQRPFIDIALSNRDSLISNMMFAVGTPIVDLGRVSSLVYAISEAVRDEPSISGLVMAGAAYFVYSGAYNICRSKHNRVVASELARKIEDK